MGWAFSSRNEVGTYEACWDCKQESWQDKICGKLSRERNDGQSDHEEARISRNLFDLFEQTARTEEAITTATTNGMLTGQETERAEQGHFW